MKQKWEINMNNMDKLCCCCDGQQQASNVEWFHWMNSGVSALSHRDCLPRVPASETQNSLSSFSARCHGNSFLEATPETTPGASQQITIRMHNVRYSKKIVIVLFNQN